MSLTQNQIDIVGRLLQALSTANVPWANAKLLVGQAMLESANFTSRLFLTNNNTSGMKVPYVRKSKYIAGASGSVRPPRNEGNQAYANFHSIEDSILEVKELLQYNGINWDKTNTPETYNTFLVSKSYYGKPSSQKIAEYLSALKNRTALLKDFIEPVLLPSKKKASTEFQQRLVLFVLIAAVVLLLIDKAKNGR